MGPKRSMRTRRCEQEKGEKKTKLVGKMNWPYTLYAANYG